MRNQSVEYKKLKGITPNRAGSETTPVVVRDALRPRIRHLERIWQSSCRTDIALGMTSTTLPPGSRAEHDARRHHAAGRGVNSNEFGMNV